MLALFKTVVLLLIAACLAGLALMVPAHLRSIDVAVLKAGAQGGVAVDAVLEETVLSAHIGPALRIIDATRIAPARADAYRVEIRELIEQRPTLVLSGGPDRSLEDYLEQSQPEIPDGIAPRPLLPQLLPRSERSTLSAMLSQSSNANVAALLGARDLPGLIRLHPAGHPAGAPYDAGILTLAILIEGGHFSPALSQRIRQTATQATLGTPAAVRALEDFAIATLSLGRQLDHRSLADLAADTQGLGDWGEMATLFRARPKHINALFTALRFEAASSQVFTYLAEHPDVGLDDLEQALSDGPLSTRTLLEANLPIYRPVALAEFLLNRIAPHRPEALVDLSLRNRSAALAIKAALLALSGLFVALAMGAAWRSSLKEVSPVSRALPSILARNFFLSLVVGLTIWTLIEPSLLKSKQTATDSAPRIEFVVADTLQSLKEPVKAMQELNQVTLLVLALFLIMQLVIYCFCLIKIKEIAKQKLSAEMKLKLLDNEENLFDFGLYVGLGGTVLSLILVAVGIVEASLMAAYASTLFGILFVALLKVLNLRPYRRHLIMEAGSRITGPDGDFMKNIEL